MRTNAGQTEISNLSELLPGLKTRTMAMINLIPHFTGPAEVHSAETSTFIRFSPNASGDAYFKGPEFGTAPCLGQVSLHPVLTP